MKSYSYIIALLMAVILMAGCEKYETYSDMKKKEQDAIERFIEEQGIEVIDQTTFEAQGNTTILAKNQFVRFTRNGVYMQIIREGCGDKLEENKAVNILCRFMEQNIQTGDIVVRNDVHASLSSLGTGIDVSQYLDKMSTKRVGTTITASFISGMMYRYHGSASVPGGWLVPLNYVKIGRPENPDEETAMKEGARKEAGPMKDLKGPGDPDKEEPDEPDPGQITLPELIGALVTLFLNKMPDGNDGPLA